MQCPVNYQANRMEGNRRRQENFILETENKMFQYTEVPAYEKPLLYLLDPYDPAQNRVLTDVQRDGHSC
jgi:hypothetical protein